MDIFLKTDILCPTVASGKSPSPQNSPSFQNLGFSVPQRPLAEIPHRKSYFFLETKVFFPAAASVGSFSQRIVLAFLFKTKAFWPAAASRGNLSTNHGPLWNGNFFLQQASDVNYPQQKNL